MISRRHTFAALAAVAMISLSGCAALGGKSSSVVDTIAGNPDLSTLNDLVQKSGLAPVLSAVGPYTVFAPSNAAFKAVPAKTMAALATDPAALKDLLTFHVVAGKLDAAAINGGSLTTVQGGKLAVAKAGTFVTVDDAMVTQADVAASNGVVHVIDRVLTPPKK
jgi:uncharacterized surface protein with fasciclin (FAS1) repeats